MSPSWIVSDPDLDFQTMTRKYTENDHHVEVQLILKQGAFWSILLQLADSVSKIYKQKTLFKYFGPIQNWTIYKLKILLQRLLNTLNLPKIGPSTN